MGLENITIASPDVGGTKRANTYAKMLEAEMVICHKTRVKANEVGNMTVIGDVKDRDVIIVDDMIDTAGTITKAAN
ncbi:MAG: ribose-phosphate pyrophosphokinase, partial [Bacteroidetes bacterium]|nr:ribose-phosphate pyrophosphokinase [Bacteroidota bacterium]